MKLKYPKYHIGDTIKDDRRNFTLTRVKQDKKTGKHLYQYKCNKCGYDCSGGYLAGKYIDETWVNMSQLKVSNCRCCASGIIVPEINSVYATRPDLVKYFKNVEDSKKYGPGTDKIKIDMKCPDCGAERKMYICDLKRYGFTCPRCSDKISLGEKMMYSVLRELRADFTKELTTNTFEWCKNYRYDFYIFNYDIIIEVHGIQHYRGTRDGFSSFGDGMTFEEITQNDKDKIELAKKNGIKNYFVINASESDFDFIKNSILSSELTRFYDFSNIDWNKIRELTSQSIIKNICKTWMENKTITLSEISEIYKFKPCTIRDYLKIGTKLGWCDYDGPIWNTSHFGNFMYDDAPNRSQPIKCLNNNIYFKSSGLCSKHSKSIFGKYLGYSAIRSRLINNKTESPEKYNFKYVTKEEFNKAMNDGCVCYGTPFLIQ